MYCLLYCTGLTRSLQQRPRANRHRARGLPHHRVLRAVRALVEQRHPLSPLRAHRAAPLPRVHHDRLCAKAASSDSLFPVSQERKCTTRSEAAAALTFVPSSAPSCQTFSSRAGACGLSRRTIQPIPYHSPPPPLRSAFRGQPSIAAERRSWRGRCAHGSDQLGVSHVPQAGFSSAIAHVLLLSRWLDTEPFAAPFDQRGNCPTSTWFQTAAFPNEFSRS